MTVRRVYIPGTPQAGAFILDGENLTYLRSVLRLRAGDRVTVFDGRGAEYETVVRDCTSRRATLEVKEKKLAATPSFSLTLAQSLAKGDKMDFIIQKATELGATTILPFISSRAVPRLSGDKAPHKVSRWRKIAAEAARQCGRAFVPEVTEIQSFESMLAMAKTTPLSLICWEEEKKRSIRDVLQDKERRADGDIFVAIGPEGGFTAEEVGIAGRHGFLSVSLGGIVLRAETAPIVVLAVIQYEKGMFAPLP